jgi:hypothetical protein
MSKNKRSGFAARLERYSNGPVVCTITRVSPGCDQDRMDVTRIMPEFAPAMAGRRTKGAKTCHNRGFT